VITADGSRIPADVVVLNPDLPIAYRDLLPRPGAPPALLALLRGAAHRVEQAYGKIAHHNIHFGTAWRGTFDEVIRQTAC
jgi:phytoene desaturase